MKLATKANLKKEGLKERALSNSPIITHTSVVSKMDITTAMDNLNGAMAMSTRDSTCRD